MAHVHLRVVKKINFVIEFHIHMNHNILHNMLPIVFNQCIFTLLLLQQCEYTLF